GRQGFDPVEGFAVLFSFVHTAIEVRLPWLGQRRSDVLWICKEYLCLEVLHDLVCALFSNAFDLHANVSVEFDLDEFALLLVKQETTRGPESSTSWSVTFTVSTMMSDRVQLPGC